MSIFQTYTNTTAVYDDVGSKGGDRLYPDCEADYLLEVISLSNGRSKNKKSKNNNRPYAAGEFRVLKVNSLGRGSEKTRIKEGSKLSWHCWLPRDADPADMSLEDKYNLAEAMQFGAALIGLRAEYVGMDLLAQIFADDGRKVVGKQLGESVTPSEGDGDMVFYNPSFYPVDELGERVQGKTPEELAASKVG